MSGSLMDRAVANIELAKNLLGESSIPEIIEDLMVALHHTKDAIQEAPHEEGCPAYWEQPCTCWKAKVMGVTQ